MHNHTYNTIVRKRYFNNIVTMHPKIAEHPLEERPARRTLRRGAPSISFAVSKLSEDTKAPEQSRAPLINLSLTETPAPHRAGKNYYRTKPRNFEHAIFRYKKGIFLRNLHFARRPASQSAESAPLPRAQRAFGETKGLSVLSLRRASSAAMLSCTQNLRNPRSHAPRTRRENTRKNRTPASRPRATNSGRPIDHTIDPDTWPCSAIAN